MTNAEKYKVEIRAVGPKRFAVENNQVADCLKIDCEDCLFFNEGRRCDPKRIDWLMKEEGSSKKCVSCKHLKVTVPDALNEGHAYCTKYGVSTMLLGNYKKKLNELCCYADVGEVDI